MPDRYFELWSGRAIAIPDASQVRLRFTIRPYVSLLTAVLETYGDYDRGAPRAWLDHVRAATAELDLSPLVDIMRLTPAQLLPDFVVPPPTGPLTTIDEDLALLKATDPAIVRSNITQEYADDVPPVFGPFLERPEAELERFADAGRRAWDAVFASRWEEMRALLEREIVALLYILAVEGIEAMFARIHHRIRLKEGEPPRMLLMPDAETLGERTLWIEPMLCGPDAVRDQLSRPDAAELAYAARGVEQYWGAPTATPGAALEALLGAPRARIAAAIQDPDTTTRLAATLGIAKATVSYHLGALVDAGIADRARFGRSVFYVLTPRGRALVADFGSAPGESGGGR